MQVKHFEGNMPGEAIPTLPRGWGKSWPRKSQDAC